MTGVLAATRRMFALSLVGLIAASVLTAANREASASAGRTWIASWAAPVTGSATGGPANATVRNIARVQLAGPSVRIRLANARSTDTALEIGAAFIALQQEDIGPAIEPGTSRRITFDGRSSVTIPPETDFIYSDPVRFPVKAQHNVAVSLYLPEATNPGSSAANYNTSYRTANDAGDLTGEESGESFTTTMSTTYALTAIDVLTTEADGAVVGLGSSSLHGSSSTRDSYGRALDLLSVRVRKFLPRGERNSVISAGIGGDTLELGLIRLHRDVLSQSGVTGVIAYDLNGITSAPGGRNATRIIEEYRTLIERSHRHGVLVFCPTWPPSTVLLPGQPTEEREKLNAWIMNSGECDDVADWSEVVTSQYVPYTFRAEYQSDTIHPNQAGHRAMADATPLRWFRR